MKSTASFVLLAALFALPPMAHAQGALNFGFRDDPDRWVVPSQPIAQPAPAPAQPVLAEPTAEPAPTEAPPPDGFLAGAVSPIPEPTTTALLLAGLGVVGLLYRRRSKK